MTLAPGEIPARQHAGHFFRSSQASAVVSRSHLPPFTSRAQNCSTFERADRRIRTVYLSEFTHWARLPSAVQQSGIRCLIKPSCWARPDST